MENKQGRKKNLLNRASNKKKVLEEANNTKLRDVQVRVEDCLQNVAHSAALSAVCRRFIEESASEETSSADSKPEENAVPLTTEEEPTTAAANNLEQEKVEPVSRTECENVCSVVEACSNSSVQLVPVELPSAQNDNVHDKVPVPEKIVAPEGELVSEEDDCVIVAHRTDTKSEEHECTSRGDDDGPLSSSSPFSRMELAESANSSLLRFPDDRSDSGVSSLRSGSGDERSGSRSSALSSSDEPPPHSSQSQSTNRSPLFIPANQTFSTPSSSSTEPVRVWRDPSLLLESEPHVRHIHSVQHQSLLMSHPSTPAASGPPPTSAANHQPLYPPVPPPPSLMSPHPLQHHPHLPPPSHLYPHLPEMLWKQQYRLPPQLLPQAAHPEELMERDRYAQDRLIR